MKENKLLVRSRDRAKWTRKLSGKAVKDRKADSVYFRPTVQVDGQLRELAELMGETKNSIVEKLVASALGDRRIFNQKLVEQKSSLRQLQEQTKNIVKGQAETLAVLNEIRKSQLAQEQLTSSFFSEIFCMVHTSVSLLRTLLLHHLGLSGQPFINQPPPEVISSFEETSNLTIRRSLEDLESAAGHHELKNKVFSSENLFWRSKLRNSDQK